MSALTMKIGQIDSSTPLNNKDGFRWIVFWAFLTVLFIILEIAVIGKNTLVMILTFALFIYFRHLFRKRLSDWISDDKIIGQIEFDTVNQTISWSNHSIKYSEIIKVDLKHNYFAGHSLRSRDYLNNGIAQLSLRDNKSTDY